MFFLICTARSNSLFIQLKVTFFEISLLKGAHQQYDLEYGKTCAFIHNYAMSVLHTSLHTIRCCHMRSLNSKLEVTFHRVNVFSVILNCPTEANPKNLLYINFSCMH